MKGLVGEPGFLLLEDGTLFRGTYWPGADASRSRAAEVVFTTSMSGYQEVFTDPSYSGQIVVMTSPMIGNYGVNADDPESSKPHVAAVIVKELSKSYASWRATTSLGKYLHDAEVPVLEGVDTRRLTRHLRSSGVMRGVIAAGAEPGDAARAVLSACPSMDGLDLATGVSTKDQYSWGTSSSAKHIVAYDYGIKRNILRLFAERGCRTTIVPSTTTVSEVLALEPDGVFLSNGPGDPAAVDYALESIRTIAGNGVPLFGICLGHQLVGLAFGGRTAKLPYGHRGGNHPVKDLATGRVLITSQNHGFSVEGGVSGIPGAPDLEVTHINLNDGSVEGLRHRSKPVFGVQFHPEAAPGPHDALPLFDEFIATVNSRAERNAPNA